MRDDTVLVLRPSGVEVLPSLQEFHKRYRNQSAGWDEITDIERKRRFYQAVKAAPDRVVDRPRAAFP